MNEQFSLGDVLSVTTGRLLARDGISGLYKLLTYMTGDNVWTHQLPRFAAECRPWLLRQHPQLAAVEPPTFRDEAHVFEWLAEQEQRFGVSLPVEPIPADDHSDKDALIELAEMVGADKVIVLEVPANGE